MKKFLVFFPKEGVTDDKPWAPSPVDIIDAPAHVTLYQDYSAKCVSSDGKSRWMLTEGKTLTWGELESAISPTWLTL